MLRLFLIIISLILLFHNGHAEMVLPIKDIVITGLSKTNEHIIMRELVLAKGESFSQQKLDESIEQIKNLRIVTSIKADLKKEHDGVIIEINVIEKWTLIPVLRFGGGGGTNFFIVGLYDYNTFGLYQEWGGQYENLGGRHAGVVWYRNPRFLNKRMKLGIDIWSINRFRSIYNNGFITGNYTLTRRKINGFLEREWQRWFRLGLGVEIVEDHLSEESLSPKQIEINRLHQFDSDDDYQTLILRLYYQIGRLNYDDYIVDGWQSLITLESHAPVFAKPVEGYRLVLDFKSFKDLGNYHNIGWQFKFGSSDSSKIEQQFFLGGLKDIRGYKDNQFNGNWYWQLNGEYRFSSYHSSWLAVQHILFLDSSKIASSAQELVGDYSGPYYSFGTGLRFISPRIYRLVGRIDIAQTFGTIDQWGISFGVQQFF